MPDNSPARKAAEEFLKQHYNTEVIDGVDIETLDNLTVIIEKHYASKEVKMPDSKVTPQILKCAEAICETLRRGKWDAGHRQEVTALICEHTGAEMMPECYEMTDVAINVLEEEGVEIPDLNNLLTRLDELGYGKEGEDE